MTQKLAHISFILVIMFQAMMTLRLLYYKQFFPLPFYFNIQFLFVFFPLNSVITHVIRSATDNVIPTRQLVILTEI